MGSKIKITARLIFVLGCFLVALIPAVALAIGAPTSDPTISDVHVNRKLVVSGDVCIYGLYYIPYGTPLPEENADKTYVIRLIDTDGITQKGAIKPFVYFNKGYNYGVFSFYSTNLTWGTQYIIRISQNPAYFASPNSYDYVMSTAAYSDETDQDDNQNEMANNILVLANTLEQQYPTYKLLEGGPAATILAAPQGETYFRGAISGLQTMVPSLFLLSVTELDYDSTNWTTARADIYATRNQTTEIVAAQNATATQFGVTRQTILSTVLVLPLCLGALLITTVKYKKPTVGMMASSVFVIMGYIMGWVPAAIFATIHQVIGIYTAYVWFYARG